MSLQRFRPSRSSEYYDEFSNSLGNLNTFKEDFSKSFGGPQYLIGSLRNDGGDGDGNENVKKATGLITKTTILYVHQALSFAVTARLQRENASFHVLQKKYISGDEIPSRFLNLDMVLTNSALGGFTYI